MLLYHGTSQSRGEQILNDGIISHLASLEYDCRHNHTLIYLGVDISTTAGYVYLTNNILLALYFGDCHAKHRDDKVYIFAIDVPLKNVEPDYDEYKITGINLPQLLPDEFSVEQSLKLHQSVRTPLDINLSKCNGRYIIVSSSTNKNDPQEAENTQDMLCNRTLNIDAIDDARLREEVRLEIEDFFRPQNGFFFHKPIEILLLFSLKLFRCNTVFISYIEVLN